MKTNNIKDQLNEYFEGSDVVSATFLIKGYLDSVNNLFYVSASKNDLKGVTLSPDGGLKQRYSLVVHPVMSSDTASVMDAVSVPAYLLAPAIYDDAIAADTPDEVIEEICSVLSDLEAMGYELTVDYGLVNYNDSYSKVSPEISAMVTPQMHFKQATEFMDAVEATEDTTSEVLKFEVEQDGMAHLELYSHQGLLVCQNGTGGSLTHANAYDVEESIKVPGKVMSYEDRVRLQTGMEAIQSAMLNLFPGQASALRFVMYRRGFGVYVMLIDVYLVVKTQNGDSVLMSQSDKLEDLKTQFHAIVGFSLFMDVLVPVQVPASEGIQFIAESKPANSDLSSIPTRKQVPTVTFVLKQKISTSNIKAYPKLTFLEYLIDD